MSRKKNVIKEHSLTGCQVFFLIYEGWVWKKKTQNNFFGNSSLILFNSFSEFLNSTSEGTQQAVTPSSPHLPSHLHSNQCSLKNHQLLLVCSLSPFSIGPHPGAFGHGTVPWLWSLGECTPCWMLSNGSEWSLMSLKMQCSVWCCSPGKITICATEDRTQAYVYSPHPHTHTGSSYTNSHTLTHKTRNIRLAFCSLSTLLSFYWIDLERGQSRFH